MSHPTQNGAKKVPVFILALTSAVLGFALAAFLFVQASSGNPAAMVHAEDKGIKIPPSLLETQNTFRQISKTVMPAIVEIRTVEDVALPQGADGPSPEDFPWDFFFKDPRQQGPSDPKAKPDDKKAPPAKPRKNQQSKGLGSGIIVDRIGDKIYVLTNNHVAGAAKEITINLADEREYKATLTGADPRKDLALVSFETTEKDIPIATLGDSSELQVGDWVLAFGNPLGLEFSVTSGIVSALGRRGGPEGNISDFIQTDASINRGNSGGALVNLKGEVIGMNTWIASPTGASVGLGFAIPINNAKRAIKDFIANGGVKYGWLGASVADADKDTLASLGVKTAKGALIAQVFKDSPADKGGILAGDWVVAINGKPVKNMNEFVFMVGELSPGSQAEFDIERQENRLKKTVTIGTRDKEDQISAKNLQSWPGFSVAPLTKEVLDELEWAKKLTGVVIATVSSRSPAEIAGLRSGDVITQLNGKKITSVADFYKQLNAQSAGELKINFNREGVDLSIGISR